VIAIASDRCRAAAAGQDKTKPALAPAPPGCARATIALPAIPIFRFP
jgi:hypothetical protein